MPSRTFPHLYSFVSFTRPAEFVSVVQLPSATMGTGAGFDMAPRLSKESEIDKAGPSTPDQLSYLLTSAGIRVGIVVERSRHFLSLLILCKFGCHASRCCKWVNDGQLRTPPICE